MRDYAVPQSEEGFGYQSVSDKTLSEDDYDHHRVWALSLEDYDGHKASESLLNRTSREGA